MPVRHVDVDVREKEAELGDEAEVIQLFLADAIHHQICNQQPHGRSPLLIRCLSFHKLVISF